MICLVTGGIRSGKSRFAEEKCLKMAEGKPVVYVATGLAKDGEMKRRVELHQSRRPRDWGLVEEPLRLVECFRNEREKPCFLVDDLSTWVANFLLEQSEEALESDRGEFEEQMQEEAEKLIASLQGKDAVLVTSEVGLGGVSPNKMARVFQDALGTVNQTVARSADEVWLVASGIPRRLKG
ncbi:adenosylcobinamide kinase/adenosylcobinamide phosphate guanyltransferase [Marinithermofilum abyssi]|uniref:Adenosylcobinamide kinase n=1 Tax=Marinithermofilum abyssi TaxID=1571185 RepID=A0A8J2Y8R1_9BACL|nr:bifunctional adenosylcobinamide kinase/adenosylcobinamide-phosphate guanylyltransferase [Marinithermofilum abyssi]GGE07728.1 adenosylcobinamide kinase/adenosylcobinamide phosphate guanyltransferase [Marinithermofilum abyssi]